MAGFLFKRGTTFQLTVDLDDAGVPRNLTGATVICQLRDALGNQVAALTATLSATVVGRVTLTAPAATTTWPLGILRADIEIVWPDGTIGSSETFEVTVADRVTQ